MTRNEMLALLALKAYSAGRFDIWSQAGSSRVRNRQHIMTVLLNGPDGKNVPQAKCGVNAIQDAFYAIGNITGEWAAQREGNFVKWATQQTNGLTYAEYKASAA